MRRFYFLEETGTVGWDHVPDRTIVSTWFFPEFQSICMTIGVTIRGTFAVHSLRTPRARGQSRRYIVTSSGNVDSARHPACFRSAERICMAYHHHRGEHTSPGIDRAHRGAEQLGAIAYAGDLAAGRFSPKSCLLAAQEAESLGK
ncbi:MAG: hypothetical protein E5W95_26225 [Mesorhizobium sp.]|nr:MAG: hypothetical protein E5W95_26225 [Mesorhizobium sp.]